VTNRLWAIVPQESLEIAALEQLENDEPRVLLETDADKSNDVRMTELAVVTKKNAPDIINKHAHVHVGDKTALKLD
jgi:hypothetical protein